VVKVGYFGSYARGDWGVGSDVDLVVIVQDSQEPFHRRALAFDATGLPVPADVLVYTAEEWGSMPAVIGPARSEIVWVHPG
jgi:predicted nucleotidyltransferase